MRETAFHPDSWLDRIIANWRGSKVLGWLRKNPGKYQVCDLGCGSGQLLRELIRRGHSAVGVDVQPGPHIVVGNLNLPLPLDDQQFDLVTSLAVLEHLDDPSLNLREAHRILKPGGTLILTTPSPRAKSVLEFLAFRLHIIDPREIADHKQYFSIGQLKQLLSRSGFSLTLIGHFQMGMNTLAVAQKTN